MKNNGIPRTDLEVSQICLGTMTYGTPVGEADAIKLTQYAIDEGINLIDTANMYEGYTRYIGSAGEVAEKILGKALRARRDEAVLATKVGQTVGEAPEDQGTSPAAIKTQLDRSLSRLQTDYVDIYYLHKPDPETPVIESVGAMSEAIEQGKARYCGISNFSAEQTAELLAVADANNLPRPVIHQPPYSLLMREIEEDLLPLLAREQVAAASYRPLQSGLLTGKYRRGQPLPADSRKAEKDSWVPELTDELFDEIEAIEANAKAKGRTMTQHAIVSCFEQPAIISVVLGVKTASQIDDAIEAVS